MTFEQLLQGAEVLSRTGNPPVSGIEYDSRRVKPGDLFVAMRGESSDGNQFIDKAIGAGAVAIVTDSATEKPRADVAWAQVAHGRRALARLSANFYQRPAERLAITGITGNQRQEHRGIPGGIDSRGSRSQECLGRDHRIPRWRENSARSAHYAGGSGSESNSVGCPRQRRNGSCDGSIVPRTRAATRLWDSLRRGSLYESDSRPSRLPPHHGRVLCCEAGVVRGMRHGCSPRRSHQRRGRVWTKAGRNQP